MTKQEVEELQRQNEVLREEVTYLKYQVEVCEEDVAFWKGVFYHATEV